MHEPTEPITTSVTGYQPPPTFLEGKFRTFRVIIGDATDRPVPQVGMDLTCPIDGGQGWFTLGKIVATRLLGSEDIEATIVIDPDVQASTNPETEPTWAP